jgi:L-methionine (R)-S-oxide reductase
MQHEYATKMIEYIPHYTNGRWLTDFSNISALFWQHMPDINWVGFYLNHKGKLRLGPFQGKPACLEIDYHRGVCGKAFTLQETLLVDDVHHFPGHIACDLLSRSELVVPLTIAHFKIGVLDIDSPIFARFKDQDRQEIEKICKLFLSTLNLEDQSFQQFFSH